MSNLVNVGDMCTHVEYNYGKVVVYRTPGMPEYDGMGYSDSHLGCSVIECSSGKTRWVYQKDLIKISDKPPTYRELAEELGIEVRENGGVYVKAMPKIAGSFHVKVDKEILDGGWVALDASGYNLCHHSKVKELAVALLLWDELYGEKSGTS
jgi:hypothetical protein